MVKKYRHKTGFGDDTDYVEIDEQNRAVIVLKSGERVPITSYRINWVIPKILKQGLWVEINE